MYDDDYNPVGSLGDDLLAIYLVGLISCVFLGIFAFKAMTWAECVFWPIVMIKWLGVSLYTVVTS